MSSSFLLDRALLPILLLCGISLAACRESQTYDPGTSEPVVVREGVFHRGALPVDDTATAPLVTNAGSVGGVVTQGQSSLSYSGLVSPDAYSIAVAMPGLGSGYWVLPAGGPDVTQDNQLVFQLTADFSRDVPYGNQTVSFVAIDGKGRPGPRYDTTICILPETAGNNLSACVSSVTPQNAIVSLTWDTDVDLDLVVIAPNGKIVRAKTPTTALVDAGVIPPSVVNDPTTGSLSRDSNANCDIDSIRRESLVFPGVPPAGEYQIFVSLQSPCGKRYVNYQLELLRRVDAPDGTHPVDRTPLAGGELLSLQATGGSTLGTYVTSVTLP